MNLTDMLSYADIYDLNRIAKNYGISCNENSKNDLIQSILIAVTQKNTFDQQMNALTIEEIRLVNFLIFNQRGAYSLEDMLARIKQTQYEVKENDKWNPRDIITKFKQRGWLFNGHAQQTKYLFQLPMDLKRKMLEALTARFRAPLYYAAETPIIYRDEQGLLTDDIRSFLKFVGQNEVQLSADGYLYKKMLQHILDHFVISENGITKAAWRFGYGRKFKEYPSRFSFIYDYCYFHDFIIECEDSLYLSDSGRERLASKHKEDMLQVYRFWIKLYKRAIPNLQALVQWFDRLGKSWVSVKSLSEVLCPLIKPYYYDSADSIFNQRLLVMLLHLGLIRVGEDTSLGAVLQVSKLGSSLIQGIFVAEEEAIDLNSVQAAKDLR